MRGVEFFFPSVAAPIGRTKKHHQNLTSQFLPAQLGDFERQGAGHPPLELRRARGHVDERRELRLRLRRRRDEVGKKRRGRRRWGRRRRRRRRRRRFIDRTGGVRRRRRRRRRLWRGASFGAGSSRRCCAVVAFILYRLVWLLLLLWARIGERRRRGVFICR